ncbi:MAG: helix-turn-helix domain-containing protein [Oscillospiraceae bacterium]
MSNIFDNLLSFKEASQLWNLDDSTLRKAVASGKLIDGQDVKKFGKQWIVTIEAMERVYGKQPNKE